MTTVDITALKEPARVVNFTTIPPLVKSRENNASFITANERPAAIQLTRMSQGAPPAKLQIAKPQAGRPARLAKVKTKQFAMPRVAGFASVALGINPETVGTAELNLPAAMPRFVNAATLKRMLKADASDVLIKRTDAGWAVCENSERIDLLDDSVEFRLGAVQIFS